MSSPEPIFSNPEMEIISLCASVEQNRDAAITGLLKKKIDWANLAAMARDHNLTPLLYSRLKNLDQSLMPAGEMARLETLYRNNALHNLGKAQTLHRIIDLLAGKGIGVIAIKGPALAVQAYGDLSLRAFADLDILVLPGDFHRVCGVLTAAGLGCNISLDQHTIKYWRRFRKSIEFTAGINFIDVHQQVIPGPKRSLLNEKIWQNQDKVDLLSGPIPVPSPEHSLLCLCLSETRDGWGHMRAIADIAGLISRRPGLNWDTLMGDARETGCLRMLRLGLRLTREIAGAVVPEEVQKQLDNDPKSGTLVKYFLPRFSSGHYIRSIKTIKKHKLNNILAFTRAMDALASGLGYLVYFAFAPSLLDCKTFKLPGFLYPVYYLARPLRLLFKLAAALVRFLFRTGKPRAHDPMNEKNQYERNQEKRPEKKTGDKRDQI